MLNLYFLDQFENAVSVPFDEVPDDLRRQAFVRESARRVAVELTWCQGFVFVLATNGRHEVVCSKRQREAWEEFHAGPDDEAWIARANEQRAYALEIEEERARLGLSPSA